MNAPSKAATITIALAIVLIGSIATNVIRWGNGDEAFTAIATAVHAVMAVAAIAAIAAAPHYRGI